MALKVYNTLTRKTEPFKPLGNVVGMYTCGPTVYDYPHIGNYRAYIVSDVLKRYLCYKGFRVRHVMNITDVDDKTIRGAQKEGIPLREFTGRYEKAFFEDLKVLSIEPADVFPRATEHISEMVVIIRRLMEAGLAYRAEDGSVYYKVRAFKNYGKLASISLDTLKAGASGRVRKDEYERDTVQDFALWKAWDREDGRVFWETVLGKGRPGWHIECSAMSMKHIGECFDIHTGGIDLVFPHHQNEIAQSEGVTGRLFVKYWLHNEWLLVNGKKMSKSLGNFYTLRDVLAKGHDARAVRYLLLATHYRQQLNFTFTGVEATAQAVRRLQEFVDSMSGVKQAGGSGETERVAKSMLRAFERAMDNDLNVSEALAAVFAFVKACNLLAEERRLGRDDAERILAAMKKVNTVLDVLEFAGEETMPEEIRQLIAEREKLRAERRFDEADAVREKLRGKGIRLDDTPDGVRWKRLK